MFVAVRIANYNGSTNGPTFFSLKLTMAVGSRMVCSLVGIAASQVNAVSCRFVCAEIVLLTLAFVDW